MAQILQASHYMDWYSLDSVFYFDRVFNVCESQSLLLHSLLISDELDKNDNLVKKFKVEDLGQIGWFGEDDNLLSEVEDLLMVQRKRLEKVVVACDLLKQVKIY